jgi:tetratricopeptide (TPR) repeat protein
VHALQSALALYEKSTVHNRLALGDIYAQLGEAYIRLGRFPDAARALRSALTIYEEPAAQQITNDYLQATITWARETVHYLEQELTKSLLPHPLFRQAGSPTN